MNLSTSWYHSDFVARPNVKCPGGHFFKSGQLSKNTQNIFPGGQIFCDTGMLCFSISYSTVIVLTYRRIMVVEKPMGHELHRQR